MKNAYLVVESWGSYDDHRIDPLKIFVDPAKADLFVKENDTERNRFKEDAEINQEKVEKEIEEIESKVSLDRLDDIDKNGGGTAEEKQYLTKLDELFRLSCNYMDSTEYNRTYKVEVEIIY